MSWKVPFETATEPQSKPGSMVFSDVWADLRVLQVSGLHALCDLGANSGSQLLGFMMAGTPGSQT